MKKFNKYVERTEKKILELFKENYRMLFVKLSADIPACKTFRDIIARSLLDTYFEENESYISEPIPLKLAHRYAVPLPSFDERANDNIYNFLYKNPKFEEFVIYELKEACKLHIAQKCGNDQFITSENYFITIPKTPMEILNIYLNVFYWAKIDMTNYLMEYSNNNLDNLEKVLNSKEYQNILRASEDKDSKIDNLNLEIEKLKKQISNLKSDDDISKIISNKNKEYDEYIRIVERQNQKLKKKYEQMSEKLKEYQRNEDIEELKKEDKQLIDVDYDLRYFFVLGDDSTFKDILLKRFPNSIFVGSNMSGINLINIDMVIVITTHVSHAAYYTIKNICKTQNVPLIHSNFTNVNIIEKLILDYKNN